MMQTPLALDGLLVAEVGERISASACGSLLAQLGATVVVLEPRSNRATGSSAKWRRRASALAGKLSVACDPADPRDADLRRRLLAAADVIVSSSDFGLQAEGLPVDERRVVCDVTAFGHSGPHAGRGGSEYQLQALGGIVHTTGFEAGDPTPVRTPILEMSAGLYAAASVLVALRVRRLRGHGQHIDVALFDSAVNALPNFLALHFMGERPERAGNRHPLYAPWSSFPASDGHMLLCAATADQFGRICKLIGRASMLQDERFATFHGRRSHADVLEQAIGSWTEKRTVQECVDAFSALGIACGPVIAPDALRQEANLCHRGMFVQLNDPAAHSTALVPASPLRSEPVSSRAASSIPAPDADREAVTRLLAAHVMPAAAPARARERKPALAGVRVIEIGHYTVAPLASRQMGALGADVIKVEPPAGDAIRNASATRTDGLSHIFVMNNTDKRGLVLDLQRAGDRDQLHALLAQADVLVENLRQGALATRGFGRDVLRERHPRLVYCAISGFGAESVYPKRPAYDTVIQAMSGLMGCSAEGGEPLKMGLSASDLIGGQFGLLALLAGLEQRDRYGTTPHFDISMQDSSVWLTQYDWKGSVTTLPRMLSCRDGHVLAEGDPTNVIAPGSAWEGDRARLVAALEAAGVPAASVLTVPEVIAHPQTNGRQLLQQMRAGDDEWTVIASPLGLSETPPAVRRVMSRLGNDDAEVIAQFGLVPLS
jgi:crotonobetainyl-CoA:carnitine CoA-transferase CaiB-like acyl-CoA transferase